jgi:hypothetical protein
MDKMKDVKIIRIDNVSIECYVLENGDMCLHSDIRGVLKPSFELVPHSILGIDGTEIRVYMVDEVIEGIKSKLLKKLSKKGLISMINEGIPKKDLELSEFDLKIKKSLEFNLNTGE